MKQFYFASSVAADSRISMIERELSEEARRFIGRVISSDYLEEIVSTMEAIQKELISQDSRRKRVKISVEKYDHQTYLNLGRCSLLLRPITGSDKDAAASETFNDGWWNCFESFVYEMEYLADTQQLKDVCIAVLNAANVTSSEAFVRAEKMGNQTAKDIAEYHANCLFVE